MGNLAKEAEEVAINPLILDIGLIIIKTNTLFPPPLLNFKIYIYDYVIRLIRPFSCYDFEFDSHFKIV